MASVSKRKWTHNGVEAEAWVVRYTDHAGKRRMKTFERKKEADAYRQRVEQEMGQGVHTAERATLTFREAAEHFIGDCERRRRIGDRMSGQTLDLYTRYIRRYLYPAYGGTKLTEINSRMVQDLCDQNTDKFSVKTVGKMHDLTFLVLDFSVRRGWLRRNLLKDIRVRLPQPSKKRVAIPTKAELIKLIETAHGGVPKSSYLANVNRLALVCLASFCGMRIGEIFGLQWSNVDFDKGLIRVRHSLSVYDGLKGPKTAAGVRDVPMSKPVRYALLQVLRYWQTAAAAGFDQTRVEQARDDGYDSNKSRMRRMWLSQRIEPDPTRLPDGAVMQTVRRGGYQTADAGRELWRPLMETAGLMNGSDVRFSVHALRHAAASLFIEQGLPAMNVQRIMGHASVTMTFDVYGHLFPDDDRDSLAAQAIAAGLLRDKFDANAPKSLI